MGAKFKIVTGYPGGNDINLAMERGEVGGRGSNSWASWKSTRPQWLAEQGADNALITDVERLILAHEIGGDAEQDLLQAADSLSFLEVNVDLPAKWAAEGRCSLERGIDQHRWMFERIRLDRALALAEPLYRKVASLAA